MLRGLWHNYHSSDREQTWQQTNIGDKYNIYKIENYGGIYYGVTNYSILVSTNSGQSWINNDIFDSPDIVTMCINNGIMYILTNKSILSCELSLNPVPQKIIDLDSNSSYYQMVSDGNFLYINHHNYEIIKFDVSNNTSAIIELDQDYFCNHCRYGFDLKTFNNELYLLF